VLLLGGGAEPARACAAALAGIGVDASPSAGILDLLRDLAGAARPLVVLAMSAADAQLAIARIRMMHANPGVAVFSSFATRESRSRLLLCGADVCVDEDMSARELSANLRALARRLCMPSSPPVQTRSAPGALARAEPSSGPLSSARPAASMVAAQPRKAGQRSAASAPSSGWRVAERGWQLVDPDGRVLALTTAERRFITDLLAAPARKLRRDETPGTSGRYLDALVSRLRKKAQEQGIDLPINAVHGWGHVFMADVTEDENGDTPPVTKAPRT
jgi:DNA-binding response OmpR family regulator